MTLTVHLRLARFSFTPRTEGFGEFISVGEKSLASHACAAEPEQTGHSLHMTFK